MHREQHAHIEHVFYFPIATISLSDVDESRRWIRQVRRPILWDRDLGRKAILIVLIDDSIARIRYDGQSFSCEIERVVGDDLGPPTSTSTSPVFMWPETQAVPHGSQLRLTSGKGVVLSDE